MELSTIMQSSKIVTTGSHNLELQMTIPNVTKKITKYFFAEIRNAFYERY